MIEDTNTKMINAMTTYQPYNSLWSPTVEEWVAMLLAINIAIQIVRVTTTKCECDEKYNRLLEKSIQNDAECLDEYNSLVEHFNENDETHVDDYNKLLKAYNDLKEEVVAKTDRITSLRKRIRRLESRIARNAKTYTE